MCSFYQVVSGEKSSTKRGWCYICTRRSSATTVAPTKVVQLRKRHGTRDGCASLRRLH